MLLLFVKDATKFPKKTDSKSFFDKTRRSIRHGFCPFQLELKYFPTNRQCKPLVWLAISLPNIPS